LGEIAEAERLIEVANETVEGDEFKRLYSCEARLDIANALTIHGYEDLAFQLIRDIEPHLAELNEKDKTFCSIRFADVLFSLKTGGVLVGLEAKVQDPELLDEAKRLSSNIIDDRECVKTLSALIRALIELRANDWAEEMIVEVREIAERIFSDRGRVKAICTVAGALVASGAEVQTEKVLKEATRIVWAISLSDFEDHAEVLSMVAAALVEVGRIIATVPDLNQT